MNQARQAAGGADEAATVKRVLTGDTAAFQSLVERYQGRVYNLAVRIVKDPEQGRDIAQEAFLRAYRALGSYKPAHPFRSWLFKITQNCALAWLRKRGRRPEVPDGGEGYASPLVRASAPSSEGPEASARRRERTEALEALLERLSPASRATLLLKHQEELTVSEMSRVLGVPEGTVKSRLSYAYKQLRQFMTAKGRTDL